MKKLNFLLVLIFLFSASSFVYAASDIKIGYVDISRLFDDYYKTKDYDKVLEGEHSEFEKMRTSMIDEIRESQGKLGLLTDDKKAELEQNIEKQKADLLEFDRQKRTDLTKDRNEKIREILLEIEKIVSDYADKKKYSLILNDRVLIFGSQSHDLTEEILAILNEGQPSK